jgi:arylsulfatase A-like enzyme
MPGIIAFTNACSLVATIVAIGTLPARTFAAPLVGPPGASDRPNVVVIMTDDQETTSMRFMPRTRDLLERRAVSFSNAFVSFPLCCPSRATYLSGRYAHNHGVFFNELPYGYDAFRGQEMLPVKLREAGYRTIHVGKYLNNYGTTNPTEVPKGWTDWHAMVGTSAHWYHGYTMNHDGGLERYGRPEDADPKTYQTDVLREIAISQILDAAKNDEPFFLSLGFLAPHSEAAYPGQDKLDDPRGAPRHRLKNRDETVPRSPSFDEADLSDKARGVRTLSRFKDGGLRRLDALYQARARSLRSVDQAIVQVVETLRVAKQLQDTWIVFTSDNGFLLGEHRFKHGKYVPYEPSIRVPLMIAGPDSPRGAVSEQLVSNVDLAPTILELAGVTPPDNVDGRSLVPFLRQPERTFERILLFETMPAPSQGFDLDPLHELLRLEAAVVTPYQAVRTDRYKYVLYEDGFIELFDLVRDPDEMTSVAKDPSYKGIRRLLAAALQLMRACRGQACRAAEARPLAGALS